MVFVKIILSLIKIRLNLELKLMFRSRDIKSYTPVRWGGHQVQARRNCGSWFLLRLRICFQQVNLLLYLILTVPNGINIFRWIICSTC